MLNVSRSVTAFPRLVEQINVGIFPLSDFSKTTITAEAGFGPSQS